jgi:FAR1 DNA-binding domain
MSENHLEDYMAGYMSEDDIIYDAQPQPEIHEPDEPAASEPDHDMPPPTANRTFQSSKEAMEFINNFTRDYGYALTTARSKRDKGDGEIKVIYLHCDRSGIYRSQINEEHRVRQKSSRLSDCPFRAALRRRKGFNYWTLECTNEQHNHGPAPVHTHPTLRHMDLEARAPQIQGQLASGIHPRQIINAAMQEDVDSLIPRDITTSGRRSITNSSTVELPSRLC